MTGARGDNELNRHMAGVAPQRADHDRFEAGSSVFDRAPSSLRGLPTGLARRTKDDPMMAFLIAGSIGYGLGYLTALSRAQRAEPLPDFARKRA